MDWRSFLPAAVLAAASVGYAQDVPENVRPGRIEQQFQQPPEARVVDDLVVLEVPTQEPPANAAELDVTVRQIEIRGATAFTATELLGVDSAVIGRTVPLTRVYQIANRITAHYRAAGYVLARAVISEQRFKQDSASIVIDVVEGYVAEIDYLGEPRGRQGLLRKMAAKVSQERPHRQRTLERYLLLLNDMAGSFAAVNGTYVPVPGQPGAFRVVVNLGHDTFNAGISQTNRGSELLGPAQTEVSVGFNSLFRQYEQTSLRYITAGSGELDLYSLSQTYWLTAGGGKLTWSLSRTEADTRPDAGATGIPLNFETESTSGALTYGYPVRRSRRSNIDLRLGLTYHDGRTDSTFNLVATADQIAAVRAGIRFDWVDGWRGINLVDFELSKGFEGLGASSRNDPDLSRDGGRPDFGKVRAYVARVQSLGGPVSLLLAAEGQLSDDLLLSPEQFGVGGATFVRAYDGSEIVGDSGASGKAELRVQFGSDSDTGSRGMLYGFYEGGFVQREEAAFGQPRRESLTSAGGGIRFTLFGRLSGYVEAAVPVRRAVALEGDDDTRIFGGLSVQF